MSAPSVYGDGNPQDRREYARQEELAHIWAESRPLRSASTKRLLGLLAALSDELWLEHDTRKKLGWSMRRELVLATLRGRGEWPMQAAS